MLTTFANLASAVAASSALKFVDTPRLIITFVNSVNESVAIPNCPAISITLAISDALDGISFDISRMFWRSIAYSSSVASTVFLTPAKADSKLEPTTIDAAAAAVIAAAATPDAVAIALKQFWPTFIVASKPLSRLVKLLLISATLALSCVLAVARLAV